jgi:NitT/TauT family transport system permease protein
MKALSLKPSTVRGSVALLLVLGLYEGVARSQVFAAALMPSLLAVFATFFSMLQDGTLIQHAGHTLMRVLVGWLLAIGLALPLGVLMARLRSVEGFFMPLVSVLMPIPSLAWVPVFILWFGLGNTTTILIVFYAASFPMLLNTWTGVRSVSKLWIRAGQSLGASRTRLFWSVIIPGASPFIISGVRQSFQRAWVAVVGAEMIAASDWGLGWVIFDSKEFLNTDVMLASLVVIGIIGFVFERWVLSNLERITVNRWGMVHQTRDKE